VTDQSGEHGRQGILICWEWWPNEHASTTTYEGPYESEEEAVAAATERYPLIDEWHDASWSTVPFYPRGQFPSMMRTVPNGGPTDV
jgi:hypothetical protein